MRHLLRPAAVPLLLLMAVVPAAAQSDRDEDGHAYPQDCNDGNPKVYPGAPAACDGHDNDCSGPVDPGCERACPALLPGRGGHAATVPGVSRQVRIVRTNAGFDLAWVDERDGNPEIYLARHDRAGQLLAERRVTLDPAVSESPALASPGGTWRAVAWVDHRIGNPDVYWARLTDLGVLDGKNVRVTPSTADDLDPALVWGGDSWGLAWAQGRQNFAVRLLTVTDAGVVSPSVQVSAGSGSARRPSLAWTGSGYAVAWEDDRHGAPEIYYRAYDAALVPLTGEIRVTSAPGDATDPSLTWAGDRLVLAWRETGTAGVLPHAIALSPEGLPLGPVSPLAAAGPVGPPRGAFTGSEVEVAWMDLAAVLPTPVVARVGTDGTLLEEARPLADGASGLAGADLAWDGLTPIVAWDDAAAGTVRFARASCCGDLDGDGADRCAGDCDDGRAEVGPGEPDACNGRDDDCDGTQDPGCPRLCEGIDRAPVVEGGPGNPDRVLDTALAWDGSRAALLWGQAGAGLADRRLAFRLFGADGLPLGPERALDLAPALEPRNGTIAARPGGWAVLFAGGDAQGPLRVWTALLDTDGGRAAAPLSWSLGAGGIDHASLVWDGRGFGAAYERTDGSNAQGTVYFVRLDASGAPLVGPVSFPGYHPSVAWTGRHYVLSTYDCSPCGVWITLFDDLGLQVGPRTMVLPVTFGAYEITRLVPAGGALGLFALSNWERIVFLPLDLLGNATGAANYPHMEQGGWVFGLSVAWNGEEYAAAYEIDDLDLVRSVRIDAAGNLRGVPLDLSVPLATDPPMPRFTSLTATGDGFLVAWPNAFPDPDQVQLRALHCCPAGDPDGDHSCRADCDEGDPTVGSTLPEICDGKDNDCDGAVPAAEADGDGDTHPACADCDDADPARYPQAPERCDGVDQNCDGSVAEEGPFGPVPGLVFTGPSSLSWDEAPPADLFDVQRGRLGALRDGGDVGPALDACLVWNNPSRAASDATTPPPGDGLFYLVAGGSWMCNGTYDDGDPSQAPPRDPGIRTSPQACP